MTRIFSTVAAATILAAVLASSPARAARPSAPQPADLTPQFRAAGLAIGSLQAFEIGGIVVIRGKTTERSVAEDAGRFAQTLGYKRIANLVQIIEPPDDEALNRRAERELAQQRSLDGCKFRVETEQGVVKVAGSVHNDFQKDMAVQLLRNIDGVKAVQVDLQKE